MFEELYAHERSASVGQMLQRPSPPPPEPGAFTGIGSALADALPHAALTAGSAWAAMLDAYGKASAYANAPTVARMHGEPPPDLDPLQRDTLGKMFDSEDARRFRETAKAFAPDPVAVGFAGQLVHGLVSTMGKAVVYSVAGGPAAPVLFGGDLGINRAQELADQGVSGGTAAAAGLVTGLTSAAMLRLPPALGATRLQSAGIGAAINPVMGVVERGTIQQMLQRADYPAIAAQYKPFDTTQLAIDAATGALFGAAFHAGKTPAPNAHPEPTLSPDEHAAALILHEVRTRDGDTLTRPGDLLAANAAHDAQIAARAQLDAGEAVSVAHQVQAETGRLIAAWDLVRGHPIGPPDDPLVLLTPETIGKVLVARGDAWMDREGIAVRTGREGLVKIVVRHGPDSGGVSPVTRDDVSSLPILLRQYEPMAKRGSAGKKESVWVIDRDQGGAPLVIVVKESTGDPRNRLVTMYTDNANPGRTRSAQREGPDPEPSPPSRASQTVGDTAPETFYRRPGSQEASLDPTMAQHSAETSPELAQANQYVADRPDLIIRGEDGVDVKASDALRAADEEISRAAIEAQGFQAAIACASRFGE